jgi:predicted DNA-binding transcriptional regulator YafY
MSEKFMVVEKTIQRDLGSIREAGIGLTYEEGKWIIKTKE